MKKLKRLSAAFAAVALAFSFVACSWEEGGAPDGIDNPFTQGRPNSGNDEASTVPETVFSGAFTIADSQFKTLALVDDGTYYTKLGSQPEDKGTWEATNARAAVSEGRYTLTSTINKDSDGNNGTFFVVITSDASSITLEDGTIAASGNGTKIGANNSSSSSNDNSSSSSDNSNTSTAGSATSYLPSEYSSKTISACYAETGEDGVTASVDTFYFFSDKTWLETAAEWSQATGTSNDSIAKGTYTGDATKDGAITLTETHVIDDAGGWETSHEVREAKIENDILLFKKDKKEEYEERGVRTSASGATISITNISRDTDISALSPEPYLPDEYSSKTISALYLHHIEKEQLSQTRIALYKGKVGIDADASVSCTAIYFFSDNTFVWIDSTEFYYKGTKVYTGGKERGNGTYTGDATTDGTIECSGFRLDATTVISDGKFEADGGHCTFVRQTL